MSKRYKFKRTARMYRRWQLIYDPVNKCWCGEENPYYAPIRYGCGGHGVVDCHCGGDLCVCHNHGEVECFGCPDCEGSEDDCEGDLDELE